MLIFLSTSQFHTQRDSEKLSGLKEKKALLLQIKEAIHQFFRDEEFFRECPAVQQKATHIVLDKKDNATYRCHGNKIVLSIYAVSGGLVAPSAVISRALIPAWSEVPSLMFGLMRGSSMMKLSLNKESQHKNYDRACCNCCRNSGRSRFTVSQTSERVTPKYS